MIDAPLAIRMLNDRVLVDPDTGAAERRSGGGILIPATVQMGRKLTWAKVVAVGPNVRSVEVDDRVLFDPEERSEVEVQSRTYVLLRERDIHAVASEGAVDGGTGLYL
ncbi:GroES family chaperonin [Tessaracoccus lacteus]|uniref:GroES family chaperonin n=1 Tax=Tessaracoccus lacteus TaxID=3041766 RepID=UPI003F6924AD